MSFRVLLGVNVYDRTSKAASCFINADLSESKGMQFLANLEKLNPNQKLTLEDFEALTDGDDGGAFF